MSRPPRPQLSTSPADHNVFAGNPLHRAANERKDDAWVAAQYADPRRRLLPLWRLKAPVERRSAPVLVWSAPEPAIEADLRSEPVLLGLHDGVPLLALDATSLEEPVPTLGLPTEAEYVDARAIAPDLSPAEAGLLAQARSLVDWHARHGFCPACSAPTVPQQGGAQRVCTRCEAQHFPRTDPVVITLIHDGGDHCLLAARAGQSSGTMFTCVAGFVDQGETIEEAVRREAMEEVGVRVTDVTYQHSQPWPFPSSLMLGCRARAETTEITVDGDEIGQAYWFSRDQARALFEPGYDPETAPRSADTPPLRIPPAIAIAHHLIKGWAFD